MVCKTVCRFVDIQHISVYVRMRMESNLQTPNKPISYHHWRNEQGNKDAWWFPRQGYIHGLTGLTWQAAGNGMMQSHGLRQLAKITLLTGSCHCRFSGYTWCIDLPRESPCFRKVVCAFSNVGRRRPSDLFGCFQWTSMRKKRLFCLNTVSASSFDLSTP